MLTPQIILASSTTTTVLIGAIVLGYAVSTCLQLYYRGWNAHDNNELVPVMKLVKKDHIWEEELSHETYETYVNNHRFDWEWIASVRSMGWVEQFPPPEVSIICNDAMWPEAHKIIKAANDAHHK